eukprot:350386_1
MNGIQDRQNLPQHYQLKTTSKKYSNWIIKLFVSIFILFVFSNILVLNDMYSIGNFRMFRNYFAVFSILCGVVFFLFYKTYYELNECDKQINKILTCCYYIFVMKHSRSQNHQILRLYSIVHATTHKKAKLHDCNCKISDSYNITLSMDDHIAYSTQCFMQQYHFMKLTESKQYAELSNIYLYFYVIPIFKWIINICMFIICLSIFIYPSLWYIYIDINSLCFAGNKNSEYINLAIRFTAYFVCMLVIILGICKYVNSQIIQFWQLTETFYRITSTNLCLNAFIIYKDSLFVVQNVMNTVESDIATIILSYLF